MQNGFVYILQSLIGLYLMAFVLRLGMQWVRADFRNPIVQFVLTVTNPLVAPVRRVLAPVYKIDTATLVIFVLLQWATISLLSVFVCAVTPGLITALGLAIIACLRLGLNVYSGIVFGYVLLSWVSQGAYNPSLAMIGSLLKGLAEPLLAPVRRFIPPIAGWDLSPIFLLIGLQAIAQTLYSPAYQLARNFACNLAAII